MAWWYPFAMLISIVGLFLVKIFEYRYAAKRHRDIKEVEELTNKIFNWIDRDYNPECEFFSKEHIKETAETNTAIFAFIRILEKHLHPTWGEVFTSAMYNNRYSWVRRQYFFQFMQSMIIGSYGDLRKLKLLAKKEPEKSEILRKNVKILKLRFEQCL